MAQGRRVRIREAPLQPLLLKRGKFISRERIRWGHWGQATQRQMEMEPRTLGGGGREEFITQNRNSPMVRVKGPNKIGIVSAVPLISWLFSLKTYFTKCALCHPSSQMAF